MKLYIDKEIIIQDLQENYDKYPAQYFADKYKISLSYVYALVSKHKLSRAGKLIENGKFLIKDYLSGIGIKPLAKKYGHDRTNIKNFLTSNGIELKTQSEWNQKYTFDKVFFKQIDSDLKAYWLGFIYADGNIYNSALQIGLGNKDSNHLKQFLKDIESNHQIYPDKNCHKVIIRNEELFNDLKKLGIKERKSLILEFPSEEIVPKEFVSPFMLGYFDGDGCLTFNSEKLRWGFSIISTFEFCEKFKNYLIDLFNIKNVGIYKESRSKKNTWILSIGGKITDEESKNRIKNIYNLFYLKPENIQPLQRKKEKFLSIIKC